MRNKETFSLSKICQELSEEESLILEFIEREWIRPAELDERLFDEEDLGRLHLILDLKNNFEVNDEGVDLILHLLDQIHSLKRGLRIRTKKS